jgi:hypothetical protein
MAVRLLARVFVNPRAIVLLEGLDKLRNFKGYKEIVNVTVCKTQILSAFLPSCSVHCNSILKSDGRMKIHVKGPD